MKTEQPEKDTKYVLRMMNGKIFQHVVKAGSKMHMPDDMKIIATFPSRKASHGEIEEN